MFGTRARALCYWQSASPRRAWIEIVLGDYKVKDLRVALPTEGVD